MKWWGGLLLVLAVVLSSARGFAQPAGVTVAPPPESADRCDANWFSSVYAQTYRAVVRIDTGSGGLGAGFVFHDARHVATAYHVVAGESLIAVSFADREELVVGRVIAADAENDLALLELAKPAPVGPLAAGEGASVKVGSPVIAIGHPYAIVDEKLERLLTWSVSQGIVSGTAPKLMQTDAAVNPGNSGGPLIDCTGRVLGVVSGKLQGEGIGFVIPSELLERLWKTRTSPPVRGVDVALGIDLGFLVHGSTQDLYFGGDLGAELVFDSQWTLGLGVGLLFGEPRELAPEVFDRSFRRVMLRATGGFRTGLVGPLGFGLRTGPVVTQTRTDERRLEVIGNAPCDTCALPVRRVDQDRSVWKVHPSIGLDLSLANRLHFGYAFIADLVDFERSIHQASLRLTLAPLARF